MYTCIIYLMLGGSLAIVPGCAIEPAVVVPDTARYYEYESYYDRRDVIYRPVHLRSRRAYSWNVRIPHRRGTWVENRRHRRGIRRLLRQHRYKHHFRKNNNGVKRHKKMHKKKK